MACHCCEHDHCNSHEHDVHDSKKEMIELIGKIAVSLLLFGLSFFYVFSALVWQYVLNIIAYLIVGYDVLWNAIKNILKGKFFDENFLMALATILAIVLKDFHEAVAVMAFYQVGEFFQEMAVSKSKSSITSLFENNVDYATKICDSQEEVVDLDGIEVGDVLLVKPGEKIPVDGKIIKGATKLNMAQLTGESVPYEVLENDEILSGSVNLSSAIYMQATKKYDESTTYKMKQMIENASKNKAQSEKFITKFSKIYTPIVILLALLMAFVPPLILGFNQYFNQYLYRALTFMIISCPCALVISIPLSFFAGIGKSAKEGILAKSSQALEGYAKTNMMAFDKTGTLTKGNFEVVKEESFKLALFQEVLYNVERNFEHPLALSIVNFYKDKQIKNIVVEQIEDVPGHGIKAVYRGKKVIIGNERHLDSYHIVYPKVNILGTIIYVAYDSQYLGYVVLKDQLKENAVESLQLLKKSGIQDTYLISGDKEPVVKEIASTLAIDHVYYQMLPEDKVHVIQEVKKNPAAVVTYVGDGINDAACLLESDVGIAMGGLGSDLAIESADIVLMDDSLQKLAKGHAIAKKTIRIVKENIFLALFIKIVVLVLGAFGYAPMWAAILADVGVALLAILNSLRVLSRRI